MAQRRSVSLFAACVLLVRRIGPVTIPCRQHIRPSEALARPPINVNSPALLLGGAYGRCAPLAPHSLLSSEVQASK